MKLCSTPPAFQEVRAFLSDGKPGTAENAVPGLGSPVRQAFQPDSAATENQCVRLESLTYEAECSSPAKQLRIDLRSLRNISMWLGTLMNRGLTTIQPQFNFLKNPRSFAFTRGHCCPWFIFGSGLSGLGGRSG